jgi:tetrahydromethanopterin S-methyltransferase subunit F
MISCYQFKAFISRYMDKDLPFQSRQSFDEHMENCPTCKALYQAVLSTKISMHNFTEITVSDTFLQSLKNQILADRNARIEASLQKGFSLKRIPSFAYGFAAALLVVIVGFYLIELRPTAPSRQLPPQIVREIIQPTTPNTRPSQSAPPLLSQGQLAASESTTDSLPKTDDQIQKTNPDFQKNIKTVKEEY